MSQQEQTVAEQEQQRWGQATGLTPFHAKDYAWELIRRRRGGDVDRISQSLFDASVDLNPHQIDAALFAIQNPLSKGVLLADA